MVTLGYDFARNRSEDAVADIERETPFRKKRETSENSSRQRAKLNEIRIAETVNREFEERKRIDARNHFLKTGGFRSRGMACYRA